MTDNSLPSDELLRLEALRRLKILDTDPEERFDRITRLARRLFDMPIALVSLVDADRQWFKSHDGLDVSETPREFSFCAHAIKGDDVLIVNDTHVDKRFADNPLVHSSPRIRFYAGCPLNSPDGHNLGTLCVIDSRPRELSPEDVALFRQLGELVENELIVADMVRYDPTTGLPNRAGFLATADRLLKLTIRMRAPASLLLVHFTNRFVIENTLGSEEADRAAIVLTQILMSSVRDADFIGRIEPDTFALLLAGSCAEESDAVQERIMQRIAARNLDTAARFQIDLELHVADFAGSRRIRARDLLAEAEAMLSGTAELEAPRLSANS